MPLTGYKLQKVHNPVAIMKSHTISIVCNLGELVKKERNLGYSFKVSVKKKCIKSAKRNLGVKSQIAWLRTHDKVFPV